MRSMSASRIAAIGAPPLIVLLAAGTWWWMQPSAALEPAETAAMAEASEDLPVPPVPPRIAQGPDYEQCLSLLDGDPGAAAGFASGWQANGGGDGAAHCLALSRIALGHAAEGAELLERLAGGSHADPAARAIVYGQASQAWVMAEQGMRAYGTATLALSLLPDDQELLIDRAVIAGNLGRYADALGDLDHVLQLDPHRTDALTLRAAAWRHAGQLEAAERDIDTAIAVDADYPEALLERGILRQRQGDTEGAREDWQRVSDLAPDTPTADLAEQNLALLEAGPVRR